MQKSYSTRLKITGRGKIRRRSTTLGHSRMNKTGAQIRHKRRLRKLAGIHREELSRNLTN